MDRGRNEVTIPNLDFTDKLEGQNNVYMGDSLEYYGMDMNTIMLCMLNKVNSVFSKLEIKTLSHLRNALLDRYGRDGLSMLGNVELMIKYTTISNIGNYSKLCECINDKFRYNFENALKDIITYYIDTTGVRIDKLFISFKSGDRPSIVIGKAYRNFLTTERTVENGKLHNELCNKFNRLLDIVREEVNNIPLLIDIDYDARESDVRCTIRYKENLTVQELSDDNIQIKWILEMKDKYNIKYK